ncbi:MAG TPA: hypothetical protein DEP08_05190, partial [Candidatus Jacksonbacteria bacterium]|nr:hypothetical protein [Candidatus Jacksonbacteria bacterium]
GIGTTTPEAKLEVNGGVRLNTTDARPGCDDSKRGMLWFTNGGTGNDDLQICMKTGATPTWKNL